MKYRIEYLERKIRMLKEDIIVFWEDKDRIKLNNYTKELEEIKTL